MTTTKGLKQPALPPLDDQLSLEGVVELTGLRHPVIKRRLAAGEFPAPVKVPGKWPVYSRRAVEAWFRKHKKEFEQTTTMRVTGWRPGGATK